MSLGHGFIVTILITLSSVLSANYGPVFNDSIAEVVVTAGQTAVLPCSAKQRGDHMIIWMNPSRILFSQGEQIVIDDSRVSVQRAQEGDWNLVIKHVRYNDSGEYSCAINTKPIKMKKTLLYVHVPPHILNEVSSRDLDVEEDETVQLTCKATGVPTPNITWYRHILTEPESKEYLNVVGELLELKNIKRYQSGMYVCVANNDVPPPVTRSIEVKVQYPPVVKLLNLRQGQTIGRDTILDCSVTAHPRPKIDWIKHGKTIKDSYKHRFELYPKGTDTFSLSLMIMNLNSNDFGEYTCEAWNRMGKVSKMMVLYEYREPTSRTEPYTLYPMHTSTPEDEYYHWTPPNSRDSYGNEYIVMTGGQKRIPDYSNGYPYRKSYGDPQGYYNKAEANNSNTFAFVLVLLLTFISNHL